MCQKNTHLCKNFCLLSKIGNHWKQLAYSTITVTSVAISDISPVSSTYSLTCYLSCAARRLFTSYKARTTNKWTIRGLFFRCRVRRRCVSYLQMNERSTSDNTLLISSVHFQCSDRGHYVGPSTHSRARASAPIVWQKTCRATMDFYLDPDVRRVRIILNSPGKAIRYRRIRLCDFLRGETEDDWPSTPVGNRLPP